MLNKLTCFSFSFPSPLDLLLKRRPLNLVIRHPGQTLGDQRRQDSSKQGGSKGRDDHWSPQHGLNGGLSVQGGGRGGGEQLGLRLIRVVILWVAIGRDSRGWGRGCNLTRGAGYMTSCTLVSRGQAY